MTEYMVSPLYKRILYDRAPTIGLTKQEGNKIYLKSKFFEDFETLEDYKKRLPQEANHKIRINGFEKVIAASLFLEEADYHSENIGIVTKNDGEIHAVKIDHGRSAWGNAANESDLMRNFVANRIKLGYENIEFNVHEFNKAINEIKNISLEEMETIIQARAISLKNSGFKPNSHYYDTAITSEVIFDSEPKTKDQISLKLEDGKIICQVMGKPSISIEKSSEGKLICNDNKGNQTKITNITGKEFLNLKALIKRQGQNSTADMQAAQNNLVNFASEIGYSRNENDVRYKKLEQYYVDKFSKQKKIFEELSSTLSIASKIDGGKEFENGGWIQAIYGNEGTRKDPVVFAMENKLTIETKDPLAYSLENSKTSNVVDKASRRRQISSSLLESATGKENIPIQIPGPVSPRQTSSSKTH